MQGRETQKAGCRPVHETHGESYDFVRGVDQLLHQACATAELTRQILTKFR